jgi:hypothetical protein
MRLLVFALTCATLVTAAPLNVAGGVKKSVVIPKDETIAGTLTIARDDQKIIYVETSDKVVYDFRIGAATKITENGAPIAYADLSSRVGKQVQVVFHPLKTGNAAVTIEIR